MAGRDAFRWLLPLSFATRYLARPFGEWTAIVSNGGNGSLTVGYFMAPDLRAEVYELLWHCDIRRVALLDARDPGGNVRVVQTYRDSGWHYHAQGEPLSEEDPSWARAKSDSKRLTADNVLAVLGALAPGCGRNPWSLDGPPMIGIEDGSAVDFPDRGVRPHLDDIGLDGPAVSAPASDERAGLTLAPFITPATFLTHHRDGSFPGGGRAEIESLLAAIGTCAGVTHVRFELQAWEDIEDAPYAESIWVLGTTKQAIAAALKNHPAAPDAIETVASKERPPELWPGRWLRLWWD